MQKISFIQDVSAVDIVDFRPWMVETAYDYFMTAKRSTHRRAAIQNIMSALSIEILLKSFSSSISANEGRLDERYTYRKKKGDDGHNLNSLLLKTPLKIKDYLFSDGDLETLSISANMFKNERYFYEKSHNNAARTDSIDRLAAQTLCKIIHLYHEKGCKDPFILDFDVTELYLNEVRSYA
ncbi:hypothetical protein OVA10_20175 [Lelliottia sp. SL45]|uniref:hypothetical protein n=1 Tax=Lelliottia sp. SL45 TaxID=2994665 RepID=UPI00227440DB|nr:hypothetical protein [Lelliottia sp. SL45]MCY1700357.1 hypothetical protein [Lelliottia sp. SL45]